MDNESAHLLRFLQALAECHVMLNRLAILLRQKPQVAQVATSFSCWKYPCNLYPFLEHCVEAHLLNGKTLTWSLDVTVETNRWNIDYDVSEVREYGEVDIIDFPEKSAATLDELMDRMLSATAELADSATSFDFESHRDEPEGMSAES